jgi:pSer/pThr/pTyr-binding forkhead associated (FHA) protein
MVHLTVLSGAQQGASRTYHRHPVRVGREPEADFRLEEPGVWPRHLTFDVRWTDGVWLEPHAEALTTVNGERLHQGARLRNGDVIEAGSVRLRFGIGPARQRGMRWRERVLWTAMLALCAGQVYLLWRVLP